MNNISDKKCAPGIVFTNGSCFSTEQLKKITLKYNNKYNKKLNININKKDLVYQLQKELSNICKDQKCWTKQHFLNNDNDESIKNIIENTFRPDGPKKNFDWLSTTHINDVFEQYQNKYNDFTFLGAVPIDFDELPILGISDLDFKELQNNNINKFGVVFNFDEHYKDGSHWVALYSDLNKDQIYYFDSYGSKPKKRIRKFVNRILKYLYQKKYNKKLDINNLLQNINNNTQNIEKNFDVDCNNIRHQFGGSECGVYSINFILRLLKGETFKTICNNITTDNQVNKCRNVYFHNSN